MLLGAGCGFTGAGAGVFSLREKLARLTEFTVGQRAAFGARFLPSIRGSAMNAESAALVAILSAAGTFDFYRPDDCRSFYRKLPIRQFSTPQFLHSIFFSPVYFYFYRAERTVIKVECQSLRPPDKFIPKY